MKNSSFERDTVCSIIVNLSDVSLKFELTTETVGYNYETFAEWYESPVRPKAVEDFINSPKVGQPAPNFEAVTSDGYAVRLSDFKDKANIIIEFGCTTCPPFINSVRYTAISMEKLYNEYRKKGFEFFLVYVREAHPGEKIKQHKSYQEKLERAKRMKREEEIAIPILVDTFDGDIHRSYGSRPNGVFVINRKGILVHKAQWIDTLQLKDVLDNILEYENAMASGHGAYLSYSETLRAIDNDRWADLEMKKKVLHKAGDKAIKDWKEKLYDNDPI